MYSFVLLFFSNLLDINFAEAKYKLTSFFCKLKYFYMKLTRIYSLCVCVCVWLNLFNLIYSPNIPPSEY